MELDDLKAIWKSQSGALEKSLALNAVLLSRINLGQAERRVSMTLWGVALQLVLDAVALLLIGSFAADRAADARYLLPAVALGIFAILLIVDAVAQIVEMRGVDYDEPVVLIQERLLHLRARRIKRTMWTLALAPLMWPALAIVAMRGLFGIDVYAVFGLTYVAANVAFGLAVLGVSLAVARRGSHLVQAYPRLASLLNDLGGKSLAGALDSLDALTRFASE